MDEEPCTQWILETIDQLRKRKARPDAERICHMVERKHGRSCDYIQRELSRLVTEGIVVKVEYKGNTSYRNAAKWKRSNQGANNNFFVLGPNELGAKLRDAITSVVEFSLPAGESAETAQIGATLSDIEEWLSTQEIDTGIGKSSIEETVTRELEAGNIEQIKDGSYRICQPKKKEKPTASGNSKSATQSKSGSPTKRGRPPGKRKRVKRSLPEYETEPPAKVVRPEETKSPSPPPGSTTSSSTRGSQLTTPPLDDPRCDFCQMTSETNKKGQHEDLLICKDCQAKAHPSCMSYSVDLAARARSSPWQCIDCKTCCLCEDAGDPDAMLFCDACDKGYHMNCHDPPVDEKPQGKWVCKRCMDELGIKSEDLMQDIPSREMSDRTTDIDGLPTPSQSPLPFQNGDHNIGGLVNGHTDISSSCSTTVPDASDWTIEDVAQFFSEKGFSEQAQAFREQEIDGKSLLLMKRSDVLTGLSVRLGPALKMYNHVQKLQIQAESI